MRVIQDSDDEFDDDLEADVPPPKQPDASEKQLTNDVSPQPHGTGSTESLKRAIQKAHRAHLQSPPSQNEPQSSVSLPEHPNKRRKTSVGNSPCKSQDTASPKGRGPVTYGKRSKSVFSSPFTGLVDDQVGIDATGKDLTPFKEAMWDLEGTMRANYAHHEPMAMFPEPSSTIPNATLTQQRVLEGVNAPTMLGQDSDAEPPRQMLPPEPSVPWSDIMKFSPANTGEQSGSSHQEQPGSDFLSATPFRKSQQGHELPVSQQSKQASPVPSRGSPSENRVLGEDLDPEELIVPPAKASPLDMSAIPPTASSRSHPGEKDELGTSPRRRKSQAISIHSSDDDLAAMDMPKEHYKPRPSRSRSLKIDNEQPIDYSVKPEKAKKVSKRRRTTAATNGADTITTPQKVQQICDMGFTPSTTERALKKNNGDVMQTVDWLVTNGIGEDELAPHKTPRKDAASKMDHQIPTMDRETIEDIMRNLDQYRRDDPANPQNAVEATVATSAATQRESVNNDAKSTNMLVEAPQIESPKVRVIIPKKSPKAVSSQTPGFVDTSSKKAKRRKTTLDQPEPGPMTVTSAAPEVIAEKKRGRGRPKKAAKTAASAEIIQEAPEKSIQEVQQDEALQTKEPNLSSEKISPQLEGTAHAPKDAQLHESGEFNKDPLASAPPPPKNVISAAASRTPERSTKTTSRSPKGKVPYRVGLSKRARIAPLLRTLKK